MGWVCLFLKGYILGGQGRRLGVLVYQSPLYSLETGSFTESGSRQTPRKLYNARASGTCSHVPCF